MTTETSEVQEIFKATELYPIITYPTRYEGKVEGFKWIAIPNCEGDPLQYLADELFSDDEAVCNEAWFKSENTTLIGCGQTPNEALVDLLVLYGCGDEEELTPDQLESDSDKEFYYVIALLTAYLESDKTGDFDYLIKQVFRVYTEWDVHPSKHRNLMSWLITICGNVIKENNEEPEVFLQKLALANEATI